MSTAWFTATADRGGVMIDLGEGEFSWVWQDQEQAREIIQKLQRALDDAVESEVQ